MASVGVTVTNTNPVRKLMPRPSFTAQKTIDGLSYLVTKPDGSTVLVPAAVVDALFVDMPGPKPIIDRPKGATIA